MKTILCYRSLLAMVVAVVALVPLGCTSSDRHDRYGHNYSERTYAGRVSDIDRDDREVTIRSSDTSRTFRLANEVEIFRRDGRHTDIRNLRVGDRVIVYYSRQSGKDFAMRIVPEDVVYSRAYSYRGSERSYPTEETVIATHYTGTVAGIDREEGILTLNIANPSKEGAPSIADRLFKLTPDTRIILENDPDATLDNIHHGDRVTVVYHQEGGELVADRIGPMGIVVERETVSPSYEYRSTSGPNYSSGSTRQHTLKGAVVSLNSETRTVTVKGFSTNYAFQLGDTADIVLANSAVSRNLRSLRIGDEVEISYTEGPEGRIAHSIVVRGAEPVPE